MPYPAQPSHPRWAAAPKPSFAAPAWSDSNDATTSPLFVPNLDLYLIQPRQNQNIQNAHPPQPLSPAISELLPQGREALVTTVRDASGEDVGQVARWKDSTRDGKDMWSFALEVHPTYRRQGVGSAALRSVLGEAASNGVSRFETTTKTSNEAACKLLEKLGFVASEIRSATWPPSTPDETGKQQEVVVYQLEFGTRPPLTPAPALPVPEVHWSDDGEPYLVPLPGFIITPYRNTPAEIVGLMELCNHPGVGKWAHGRPYPFTEQHALARLNQMVPPQTPAVSALRADPGAVLAISPFSVIREVSTGRYAGDMVVRPHALRAEETWTAYALHPDFHGRGIGSAAVAALLGWARAGVGADRVHAAAEVANAASGGLLRKLGFTRTQVYCVQWPADKGGMWKEVGEWEREL